MRVDREARNCAESSNVTGEPRTRSPATTTKPWTCDANAASGTRAVLAALVSLLDATDPRLRNVSTGIVFALQGLGD